MMYTHQYSALKIGGHLSKEQTSYQACNRGEDEGTAQSPGHRKVISCNTPISSYTGQIMTTACSKIYNFKKIIQYQSKSVKYKYRIISNEQIW